tara:strand:- start:16017 stop:16244 length:228 start_codon:yes stop_codon:yes gene_type:complete
MKMHAFTTTGDENGTAATEAAICEDCMKDPANVAYCREQASQADDLDPESDLVDCSENDALRCCICSTDIFGIKE